ncbi:MAG: ThiF family adenylyltransferase [Clostridiales Family XIII bacterium]|jgi:adenylyltransferase/sulfurtransferase|nr:ThiF family adenylyltransferase [Clostridiales Family XIII bacterium]
MDNNRYSRQIIFPGIGRDGQEKLAKARVAVIGAGALGSVIAEELCRAGVGYILLADRDYVDITNLHRQFLYDEEDVKQEKPKAEAAADHLKKINSQVTVEPYVADIDSSNIEELVKGVDLLLDATDNFEVRALINEACHKHKKPWVYGAGLGAHGATMDIFPDGAVRPDGSPLPQGGPCLRCIIRDIPAPGSYPTCSTAGVIPMVTAIIASIECAEAVKIITGSEDLNTRYLDTDIWANTFDYVNILRDEECQVCGTHRQPHYEFLGKASGAYTNAVCGQDAYQVVPAEKGTIDFEDMAAKLSRAGAVRTERFSLHFEGEGISFVLFKDGRAIIKGAKDEPSAKQIYSEYIGL